MTSSPKNLPGCLGGTVPGTSIGTGNLLNEIELVACFAGFTFGPYPEGNDAAVLVDEDAAPARSAARP